MDKVIVDPYIFSTNMKYQIRGKDLGTNIVTPKYRGSRKGI